MGMFDTVHAQCPNCGHSITTQSKAGLCLLNDYSTNSVPPEVAADVEGEALYCEGCDTSYMLTTGNPRGRVSMFLEPKIGCGDYD